MSKKFFVGILILLALFLFGCAIQQNPLLGKWKFEKVIQIAEKTGEMTEIPVPKNEPSLIMEFKPDEVCSTGMPGLEGEKCYPYTVEGDVIHVVQGGKDSPAVWKISGDNLTITPKAQEGQPAMMLVLSNVK